MNPMLVPLVLLVAFLAGLSLGLARFRFAIFCGLALSSAPALATAVNVLLDTSRDPTSHNLWPFEIVLAAAAGLVPAAGLLLGWVVRKVIPVPVWAVWIPAALAVILAVLFPLFSQRLRSRDESDITATLKRLWQAEMAYSKADPRHRFTCEGPLLAGFERDPRLSRVNDSPLRNWMRKGQYSIILRCSPGHFRALADPRGSPSAGNLYCVDETGIIHSTPAVNNAICGR
jgi:hypothetical protein